MDGTRVGDGYPKRGEPPSIFALRCGQHQMTPLCVAGRCERALPETREVTETRPGAISQGSGSQEGYSRQEASGATSAPLFKPEFARVSNPAGVRASMKGGMETDGEVAVSGCYRTSIPIRTAGLYVRGKDRVKVFLAII